MDEKTQAALAEALGKAIENERYGRHFYRMAARTTEDEQGRETFETLASEEEQHEDYLMAHLKALRETGALDPAASLGKPAGLKGPNPIFSDALRGRVTNAHFEMAALGIGVQVELDSVRFYEGMAERASTESEKKLFSDLADWESGHYHALLAQQESLKEAYWQAGGFAPF